MTLPEQLHAIAERLDALEGQRLDVLAELWELVGGLPGEVIDRVNDRAIDAPGDGEAPRVTVDRLPATESPATVPAGGARASGGGTVAAAPGVPASIESSRRARTGQPAGADGRRAPAGSPAAPPRHAAGPEGTSAATDSSNSTDCPDCGKYLGSASNVGRHKRFCKGRPEPTPVEPLESVTDPRVIDEECRKCGQRFTWKPALVSHERACRGAEAVVA